MSGPVDRNPLVPRARRLRRSMTDAEVVLWSVLRSRQLGVRFRRQAPVGRYIADFLSHEAMLIVEVDGEQHGFGGYDGVRDGYLRRRGYEVLRFWNHEVLGHLDMVCRTIESAIEGPE